MSKFKSGAGAGNLLSDVEATFYASVDAAEVVRQVALKAATTPAAARTADVNYHNSVVAAANAAGLSHLGLPSRTALKELGVT